MSEPSKKNYPFPSSFYDKYIQDDENMQAKIKPVLNQIQENRVAVKELHTQFGVKFSEMMNSYKNRVIELKEQYEDLIPKLQIRQNSTLNKCSELLQELNQHKP